jgi:hypothetical protein
MFKKYIGYLKDNPNGYWFKRKLYGWGWVPVKSQGWLVVAIFVGIVLGLGSFIGSKAEPTEGDLFLFFAGMIVSLIALFSICLKKGEKPCWQWGDVCDDDNVCRQRNFFVGRAMVIILIVYVLAIYFLSKCPCL